MRKLVLLSLVVLPAVVAAACSSLLGDFSVGPADGGGGDDATAHPVDASGTPDSAADANGPPDGGSDAVNTVDASIDAPSAPRLLTCGEDRNARVQLNVPTAPQQPWDQIAVADLGNGTARVLAYAQGSPTAQGTLFVFDFNPGGGATATLTNTFVLPRILDVQHYPGGFAVLSLDTDPTGSTVLAVYRIVDANSAWEPREPVSPPNPLPASNNRLNGALTVVNAGSHDYYVATLDTENGADFLRAQHQTGGPQPLPFGLVGRFNTGDYNLGSPAFAFDGTHAYIELSANGPNAAGSNILTMAASNIGGGTPYVMTADAGTLFAFGLSNSTVTPGSANVGFFAADLSVPSVSFHVGQSPIANLGSLQWPALPTTLPPPTDGGGVSLEDLIVDKSNVHWESFTKSEALLAVARTFSTNTDQGINFIWWDAVSGAIRARRTGQTRLLSDLSDLYRANITFSGTPAAGFASFLLVYEREPGVSGQAKPGDLWATTLTCIVQ